MFIYDTGLCPRCKGTYTGRVLPYFVGNIEKTELKHLKRCDPVIFSPRYREYNCFCMECGVMWQGDIKIVKVSKKAAKEYLKKIGVDDDYFEAREDEMFRARYGSKAIKNRKVSAFIGKLTAGFLKNESNGIFSFFSDFPFLSSKDKYGDEENNIEDKNE